MNKKKLKIFLLVLVISILTIFVVLYSTTIKSLIVMGAGGISSILQKGQDPVQLSSEFVSASIQDQEIMEENYLTMDVKINIKNTSLPDGIKTLYLVGCENIVNTDENNKIYVSLGHVINLGKLIPYNSEQEINFDNMHLPLGEITCSYNSEGIRECTNNEIEQLKELTLKSCILLYSSDIDEDRLWTLHFQFVNKDSSIKNYGKPIKTFNNVRFNPETDVYEFVDINQVLTIN